MLEAMEQEVFRCKGMVECGLNAYHLMIADYTHDLKVDGKSMKDIVFSLNEKINFLHSQIHDLQSQVFEYEARFKGDYSGVRESGPLKRDEEGDEDDDVDEDDHRGDGSPIDISTPPGERGRESPP
ncbi:40S ribosomal protein S5-1 [Hordeum vulgare]|nr:40S ribosomal protein S5-1 [Hordeum vulgare]